LSATTQNKIIVNKEHLSLYVIKFWCRQQLGNGKIFRYILAIYGLSYDQVRYNEIRWSRLFKLDCNDNGCNEFRAING